MSVLLEAKALVFGRRTPLSAPLSFEVQPGRIVALLGRNGRGKTTLLDTLMGILPPLSGQLSRNVAVGYVPQKFSTGLAYSVFDVVLMGRARQVGTFALPTKEDEAVAEEQLARLELSSLRNRDIRELSGGQQQLVMIARALAGGASLLLLDEPMAALDLNRQEAVLQLMKSLAASGMGVVFTTHEPVHAGLVADEALLLMPERRHLVGRAQDVLSPDNLEVAFGVNMDAVPSKRTGCRRLVPDFRV